MEREMGFRKPPPPSQKVLIKFTDLSGRGLLIVPTSVETVPDKFSDVPGATKEMVHARVTEVDGPDAGRVHKDLWIHQVKVVEQLIDAIDTDEPVLGRLGKVPAYHGGPPVAWGLTPPTPDLEAAARRYDGELTSTGRSSIQDDPGF
jgi:hypothetical protein